MQATGWQVRRPSLVARPKQRRADAHLRRAEAHRGLEIGAHAHAEFAKTIAYGDFSQEREVHSRFILNRRDTHEALHRKAIGPAGSFNQRVSFGRANAGLLRFGACIDLNQNVRTAPLFLRRIRERAGELLPVQHIDRVKQRNRICGLICLQGTDQSQLEIGEPSAPGLPSTLRLLNPILTEDALPGEKRRLDAVLWLLLGDGH